MKPKYVPFLFPYAIRISAGLALVAGSLVSCTYTLPTVDEEASSASAGGGGGAGGTGSGGSSCGPGLTHCNGACVDMMTNSAHCGDCNAQCAEGTACLNGECKATVCKAGESEPCYNGPDNTKDVGLCHPGSHTCLQNETGYGPCIDEVVPKNEVCGNDLDEDCNGEADQGASCLTDNGLVVRYVLNEDSSGMEPGLAFDSATNPLHLTVDYGAHNNMSYAQEPTGRGLRWVAAGSSGTASVPVNETKVYTALEGKTQATLELVVKVDDAYTTASRIFTIGLGAETGRFSLVTNNINRTQFWLSNVLVGDWPLNFASSGRCVLHVVVNTMASMDTNRVRLFLDGKLVTGSSAAPPAPGTMINIGPDRLLYLGNREQFMRSFAGSLYYAALYDRPLTPMEITAHATYLKINDDQ